MGTHTGPTSHWVEVAIALMGTHTGSTSHWIEVAIALWGHTLDQHHTGVR